MRLLPDGEVSVVPSMAMHTTANSPAWHKNLFLLAANRVPCGLGCLSLKLVHGPNLTPCLPAGLLVRGCCCLRPGGWPCSCKLAYSSNHEHVALMLCEPARQCCLVTEHPIKHPAKLSSSTWSLLYVSVHREWTGGKMGSTWMKQRHCQWSQHAPKVRELLQNGWRQRYLP